MHSQGLQCGELAPVSRQASSEPVGLEVNTGRLQQVTKGRGQGAREGGLGQRPAAAAAAATATAAATAVCKFVRGGQEARERGLGQRPAAAAAAAAAAVVVVVVVVAKSVSAHAAVCNLVQFSRWRLVEGIQQELTVP
jgi:ApbE superfamily uncharacterized protein (UPF0280 family)